MICGRPANRPGVPATDSLGEALCRGVTVRHYRWIAIQNRPVCCACAAVVSRARGSGHLGSIGPSGVVTAAGKVFGESQTTQEAGINRSIAVYAPFMTGDNLLKIVHLAKFSGYKELVTPMGTCVCDSLRHLKAPIRDSVVVGVPMRAVERRRRGFNLAEELARRIAHEFGISFLDNALEKSRQTRRQSLTPAEERADNVRGAFSAGVGLDGRMVLLIDDLVTSGATAGACAAALVRAGAVGVAVACFGRAM